MAHGPDPNRDPGVDREAKADDEASGAGLGNLNSTRLGFPTWLTVLVVVAIAVAALLFLHNSP